MKEYREKKTEYANKERSGIRAVSFITAALLASALLFFVFMGAERAFPGLFLPQDVSWEEKTIPAGNGKELLLSGKKLILRKAEESGNEAPDASGDKRKKENRTLWESDPSFRIQDMLLADLDRDGDKELCVLLWKRGKFGGHRPFWVKKDERKWSQHIFLYDFDPESEDPVRSKWGASEIGMRVKRWKVISAGKGNGPALTGEYPPELLLLEDSEGKATVWGWQSFGLKIVDSSVSFIAFGDNLIHKKIYEYGLIRKKGNFDFLYEPFREEITAADLSALNLETPLVEDPRMYGDYPSFGTPKEVGEAVSGAGFDIVSCANNHCLDRGMTGIDTTAGLFDENGITFCGIQKSGDSEYRPYELVSKNGIRFAIFSYTCGTNGNDVSGKYPYAVHTIPEDEKLREDIAQGKAAADIAVVFIHWGTEYEKEPDEAQKYYAKLLNEAGADVVIGSHPHVIQPAEILRNENGQETLVAYSLGNFRSAQSGEDTRMGGELCFTAEHTFDGIRITGWALKEIDSFVKLN